MSWLRLALANLGLSRLTSAVNVLLMALGTASIVLLLLVGNQLSDTMSRDARGIDLVLGAKGSPVQLVLSAVYHADVPTGNIELAEAERWAEDPRIASAIPLSLGDSVRGFRIVGTTPEYGALYDAEIADGRWWSGSMEAVVGASAASAAGLEVGSTFAGAHGFSEGGHSHDNSVYRVVGILDRTGSVLDRLVLTSLDSVWDLHEPATSAAASNTDADHEHDEGEHEGEHGDEHDHDEHDHEGEHGDEHDHEEHDHESEHGDEHDHDEHDHEDEDEHGDEHDHDEHEHEGEHGDEHDHDEHDHEDEHGDKHDHEGEHGDEHDHDGDEHDHGDEDREITAMLLSYTSPVAAVTLPRQINTTSNLVAAAPAVEVTRVLQLIGVGLDGLRAFAWILIVSAGLSIFAALYGSLRTRRGDIAMLRCLGATRWELFFALLLEGLLLTLMGVLLGFVAGHIMVEVLGGWLEQSRGVSFTGLIWLPVETALIAGLLAVGVAAAAIPAIQAYRTDVAKTLAEAP
ncbi:MAG: ABC transporter permease [Pseudomonadota bacterium]